MICKNCGIEVEANEICPACGVLAVPDEAPVAEVYASPVPVAPVEAAPVEAAPVEAAPEKDRGKTFGIISLILGIFALVVGTICSCAFACLGGFLPLCCGVAGIILGIVGMNASKASGKKNTLAIAGLALSAAAILVISIMIGANAILGGIQGAAAASSTPTYLY